MPEPAPSLQDILRLRQRTAFVGRGDELASFRENFDLPPADLRKRFIFDVHGDGGVGKSTLIEQWRAIAREQGAADARIDENVYDVPEAMAALADQLGDPMNEFKDRYVAYLKVRDEVERDPQAPLEIWSRVTRTAVKAGLHASKIIPGAAPAIELLDPDAAGEAVDQVRLFLTRKFGNSKDARLLLSPVEELTPLFAGQLAKLASRTPVAMFVDTYEQTGGFLDAWLLDLIAGHYGELPSTILMTIAGRWPLDPNRWADYMTAICSIELLPFSEQEVRQLLSRHEIKDEKSIEVIYAISGGLPLLVNTLAKNRPEDPSAVGDPSGTAVDRFLKWETDESRRTAALVGAIPRRVNDDLLSTANGAAIPGAFGWLCEQAFVSARDGRYHYHQVVRAPMLRLQRMQSPYRWRETHARLADRYREWRDGLRVEDGWTDLTWLEHRVEEVYHTICAYPAELGQALRDSIDAVTAGPSGARRWAEAILEAGRDSDSEEARSWGSRLLAALGKEGNDCRHFLTALLQCERLGEQEIARALVERAHLLYKADEDTQAIRDCDLAIECDPEFAKAFAVRGAAKGSLGHHEEALRDFEHALTLAPNDDWAMSRQADTYRMLGRDSEALSRFNEVIRRSPTDAWSIGSRGQVYAELEHFDEALADFNRAIELQPKNAWIMRSRGLTYCGMKRYDDALADFNRAIELDPEDSWNFTSRGLAYDGLERHVEALSDFDRAIELAPNNAWALTNRADAYRSMKRYDEALVDYSRAIELEPNDAYVLASRGYTFEAIERYEHAVADYSRAIEVKPDFAWAIANRAEAFRSMKRYDEALADHNRAIELKPMTASYLASRGHTYRYLKRYDEALADFNHALELEPNDAWVLTSRGLTYDEAERHDDALADLDRAIELAADDPWTLSNRADTYRSMKRYDQALADYTRAIELDPDDSGVVASRGYTYHLMERYDDALADHNRAIELKPDYAWAIANRADTYHTLKRYDQALADFNRAIELDSGYALAIASRADTYRSMKRYDEALADYTRAMALDASADWIVRHRGHIYREIERYDDALADYTRAIELDPNESWNLAGRADLYCSLGRYTDALSDIKRAIELEPADSRVIATREKIYDRLGGSAKAPEGV